MKASLTRRELLAWAAAAGVLPACGPGSSSEKPDPKLPAQTPSREPAAPLPYSDSVDALFDVLLPAERENGLIVSIGAREAGVDRVLELEHFARLAVAQGFIAPLPETVLTALDDLGTAGRTALNRALDARAQLELPLKRFHELDRPTQERIVERAFEDDATRPVMLALRAACFVAWLGAVVNDAGLRDLGFPAFENFDDGLAVSGYPRTKAGRLVNAATEDLRALESSGQLDDYTVNRVPPPTPGDDLSLVLTTDGDLR